MQIGIIGLPIRGGLKLKTKETINIILIASTTLIIVFILSDIVFHEHPTYIQAMILWCVVIELIRGDKK